MPEFVCIHGRNEPTLVKTEGQPISQPKARPKDTRPCCVILPSSSTVVKGPPESPLHADLPPKPLMQT